MSFKVGDRVIRKPNARPVNDTPKPHNWDDPRYWTGTIIAKHTDYSFNILTDSGKETTWASTFFELWTPLKELL